MRPHERCFLAAMVFVLIGVLGQCLAVWIECDRETFGPKGPGANQVRGVFGQGVTPGLVALRLHQTVGFLTLLGLATTLGVIGTLKVERSVSEKDAPPNPFELDDAGILEPAPAPKHRPRLGTTTEFGRRKVSEE